MANETFIKGIRSVLEMLRDEDFSILARTEPPAQSWNNLTSDEVSSYVNDTLTTLKDASDNNLLETVSFNHLNAINNALNQFNQTFQGVKDIQPAQLSNQHHNPLNQLHAVDNQLRTCGLYAIVKLSPDMMQKKELLENQIQSANKAASDIDKLRDQVRELVDPAVAGALSNAFDVRRKNVSIQKWFWFLMLVVSGGISIWLTMDITSFVTDIFLNSEGTKANVGLVWLLRFLLLVPAYFFIAFSVSQFLRERNYEEDYAHKSSIAQTLPSYSELVANVDVKDEITSSATKVVFTPPHNEKNKEKIRDKTVSKYISDIADLAGKIRGS